MFSIKTVADSEEKEVREIRRKPELPLDKIKYSIYFRQL